MNHIKMFIKYIGCCFVSFWAVVVVVAFISLALNSKELDSFIVEYEFIFNIIAGVLAFGVYELIFKDEE